GNCQMKVPSESHDNCQGELVQSLSFLYRRRESSHRHLLFLNNVCPESPSHRSHQQSADEILLFCCPLQISEHKRSVFQFLPGNISEAYPPSGTAGSGNLLSAPSALPHQYPDPSFP